MGDSASHLYAIYTPNNYKIVTHIQVVGQDIPATTEHPFYVPKKGWKKAVDLRAGDILVTVDGEYKVVEKIQHDEMGHKNNQ